MHFHQKIHNYLLDYREKYNSNFNFLVRQRTNINDKKYPGGKFAHGLVFQGTEKYCFVALSDKSGGANATKSVGIVINPTKNNSFKAMLEIVFPGETNAELISFYKKLASKFEDINWDAKEERAYLYIGELPKNDPTILYKWLDVNFPIIRETALQTGIEKLIPSDERFKKLQDNLEKRLLSDKKLVNYWVFQGNPKIFDTVKAIADNALETWSVHAHKTKIKIGDKVILWITGDDSGCYALAEVTSELFHSPEISNEKKYYAKNPEEDVTSDKVKIKITHDLTKSPVLKTEMKINSVFDNFKGGNQGTNFSATEEEFETLLNWNPNSTKNTFQKTRAKLDPSIFDEYIDFVRSIINSLGLKPQDSRIVYSVRGSSLNFTIGQKYCINVYTSKNKESFGIISTRKISDNNEEYAGKTPQTYYNYVSKLDFNKDEQKTIIEAIKAVLKKTIKSGYYKSNDADFENYLFGIESINKKENRMTEAINQILYGPPGTGKTFYFKKQLFDKYTISETAVSEEKYFENIVSECTWFQVISMALIELGKSKVSDIIKNRWVLQKTEMSNAKSIRPIVWGQLQYHTLDSCEFVNMSSKSNITVFTKDVDSYWEISENDAKEQIPEVYDLIEKVNNFIPNPDVAIKNYEFITFHQSYSYEDFIEGIKPVMNESETNEDSAIGYQIQDGVFKKLCLKAGKNPSERYAIFIDEINRGNVSAIFGELITLIEQDKRQGEVNEISVQLPYSKALFSVPANIDIYGTMNTADRSVEALDTALRRRFSFLEMMPDSSLLKDNEVEGMNLKEVLNTINDRIEILIDRDHTIGHSYFMNIKTTEALRLAFKDKIVPLLQEYFYGDYGKIGLVLGDGFVKSHSKSNNPFANFKYEGKEELNRDFFDLVAINDKFDIKKAIETLLNNAKDN